MKKYPILDKVALWRPIPDSGLYSNQYTSKQYQLESGIMGQASPLEMLYSYAKNFTKFKLNFSLFVYTNEKSAAAVQKRFDQIVKKIKKSDIENVLLLDSNSNFNFRYIEENK